MKFIPKLPRTKKEVISLCIRWAVIVSLFTVIIFFVTAMPGKSYSGSFKPLHNDELLLRDSLKKHVIYLSDSIKIRNMWRYDNFTKSETYIYNEFSKTGSKVEVQEFMSEGKVVRNIELVIPGETDENLIIGAHYDSYGLCFGANDNATGVAAIIEIAKKMVKKRYKKTVRIVAFANEEPPFFGTKEMGSLVYAERLHKNRTKVYGMYSIETIGCYFEEENTQKYPFIFSFFYPNRANFITFVGNMSSRSLVTKSVEIFRRSVDFPSEGTAAPGWLKGIGWSDHWSFWKYGYKALMITDTAPYRYVHYHKTSDTWDKINFDKMSRVVTGVLKTIEDVSNE